MENLEYLRQISIFSELADDYLKKIDDISNCKNYEKGKILFLEGDPGEAFYYIKSGMVKISKLSADGREHILHILNAGHVFAEVTLFDKTVYPATAEILENAEIGIIKNADLEKVISENPGLALQLIKYLNRRLIEAQTKVRNLALSDTYARTAQALIKLSEEYGKKTPKGTILDLNLSRQELASIVGTTRETVTRALAEFKREKAIDTEKGEVLIINMKKLMSWYN